MIASIPVIIVVMQVITVMVAIILHLEMLDVIRVSMVRR